MDVRLKNNNIDRDECGNFIYIRGIEELLQRVRIACTVRRGAFAYNRGLGIDLSDLSPARETLKDRLDMRVKEACVDIPADVRVTAAETDGSDIVMTVSVSNGKETMTTEVRYNGLV